MKWGLVLAGGGVKGSYQIGVYQALCDLGIKISAVAGTSIGAINGALIAQGDFDKAAEVWSRIKLSDIISVKNETENLIDIKNVMELFSGKPDMEPLERLLKEMVDEEKLRRSPVDYGLVTYSLTNHTEVSLFKEEIPEGELIDYITASSRVVGFRAKKIGEESFIDGGVRNNIPVNLLTERGYENIIVADVRGIGITRGAKDFAKNVVLVRPAENIVGTLDFDAENMIKNVAQGYLDTMRAFGVVEGSWYYIESGSMRRARRLYSAAMLSGLEAAAELLGIFRYCAYSFDELRGLVLEEYEKLEKSYSVADADEEGFIVRLARMAQAKEPYFLCELVSIVKAGREDILNNKLISGTLGRFSEAAGAVMYFGKNE